MGEQVVFKIVYTEQHSHDARPSYGVHTCRQQELFGLKI